ncbi:GSCFA domain-containing protein [Chitinispirillales bacterium ANBcel5]|uniref:GSCFA domain-containing protein n=1 Tax=Cellulosispirillum alkaliphilum TaxID=3039283 RepID=UPI002A4F184F|nr:GSCFA domain-containing protein [Chitinispirillales bacterium ANBcel5]
MKELLFRTTVPAKRCKTPISHNKCIMVLGSCFAENITDKLNNYLFSVNSNPTGILFNPLSLAAAVKRVVSGEGYTEKDLFKYNDLYHCFDHHSSFSGKKNRVVVKKINESISRAHDSLKDCTHLILTFGTAFTYRLKENGRLVSNCHKLPNSEFCRKLETVSQIVQTCKDSLDLVYAINPGIKIIFTISPVRHLRNDPHENSVSKAHLMCSVSQLQELYPDSYYFPSYEILLDELRDYRFFASDMAHPSELAISFIWQRFAQCCIDERSLQFISAYENVLLALKHEIKSPDTSEAQVFLKSIQNKITALSQTFPEINMKKACDLLEKKTNGYLWGKES